MKQIFTYMNYREYLREYYTAKKRQNRNFSLRILADRAGFKARDYILRVMNGQRNLSGSGMFALSRALGHNKKEADYFRNLVGYNQARNPQEKEHFLNALLAVKPLSKIQRLREDQYDYFSQWFNAVIRSLLPIFGCRPEPASIAGYIDPPLPVKQVRKSINLLIRLGMIRTRSDGSYEVVSDSLTTGDEVRSVALCRFHESMLQLAQRSVTIHNPEQRDISGVTMGLSDKGFKLVKEQIAGFRKRVMEIAQNDSREERVCQLSIQLFPLTKTGGPG